MDPTSHEDWKLADARSYDAQAGQYARHMGRLAARAVARICDLAELAPGQEVLDVGCGPGVATTAVAARVGPGGRALGVDLSEGMIAAAERRARSGDLDHLWFRVMDAERLDLEDRSFDAVVCLSAMLHFPDVDAVLGEMRRVLRPGGRLVVSFGHVRPVRRLPLAWHVLRRLGERALRPVRPVLRAPDPLIRLVAAQVPASREHIHTAWSTGDAGRKLHGRVVAAGFLDAARDWVGGDVVYAGAEEFWDAQVAISTEIRKRLEQADPGLVTRLRDQYLARARAVLDRGGALRYAYGAQFVAARAPR